MQSRPEYTATEALTQKMEFQLLLAQHAGLQLHYETAAGYLESLHSQEVADCFRMSERIEQLLQEAGLSMIKSHFAVIDIRIKLHNQHFTVCKEAQHLFKSSKAIKKDIRSVRKAVTNVSLYSAALDLICQRIEQALSSLEFIPEPTQQSTIVNLAHYQTLLQEQLSNLLVKLKLLRKDIASVVDNFISLPHTIL